jgi:HK97 family phage major capsid protein
LYDFPVKIASEVTDLTASTVSGPVFGNLGKGMYFRNAGFEVLRLRELHADLLDVTFIGHQRADTRARDSRAFVTLKPAGT